MGVHSMFFKKGYCFDEMRLTFFSTWDAEAILEQQPGSQGPPCSPPCSPKLNLRSCESGMQVGCLELFRTKKHLAIGSWLDRQTTGGKTGVQTSAPLRFWVWKGQLRRDHSSKQVEL